MGAWGTRTADSFVRHRYLVAAILFALVVASRLPFATTHLWAWDSVLYARALEHGFLVSADPDVSRPHPPGYIWYVGLAQLMRLLVGDSNAALVLVSILSAAACTALLWLVAARAVRPIVALLIALAFAASPSVWMYSEVAYPYTLLALLSLALGASFIDGRRPLAASLAFGLASGARQDLLLLLAPLWAWSLIPLARGRRIAATALVAAGVVAWWLPSTILSGGLGTYAHAVLDQTAFVATTYSAGANGPRAIAYNAAFTIEGLLWSLGVLAIVIVVGATPFAIRMVREGRVRIGRLGTGLALWIGPALGFYALVHIGEWGYVLSVVPALFLLAALVIERAVAARPPAPWIVLVAGSAVVGAALFLGGDDAYRAIAGNARFSAVALARHDVELTERVAYVRASFPRRSTVILARDDYQLVRYYLPEYRAWYWDPDPFAAPPTTKHRAMRPTTVVVFTAGLQPLGPEEARRVELADGVELVYVPLEAGTVLELDGERYTVQEGAGT